MTTGTSFGRRRSAAADPDSGRRYRGSASPLSSGSPAKGSSGRMINASGSLASSDVDKMRAQYGANVLTKKRKIGFFRQFFKNFNDPIIRILLCALAINAVVTLGHMDIAETLGISAAILVATLVSTISEYSSSLAFERLQAASSSRKCTVFRDDHPTEVSIDELVCGDTVRLTPGMAIPADGVLIRGKVFCNQSALTGEGADIEKIPSQGLAFDPEVKGAPDDATRLFCGSTIVSGEGEMLALRVGDSTYLGGIAASLQEQQRPSPLKHRLSQLAGSISRMGYIGAVLIALSYLFNSFVIDSGMDPSLMAVRLSDTSFVVSEILRALTVAVSVVVVAVPEGLPMMITVVLSSNMKRMLRGGVLVRRLTGIETAGSLNVLFCDKTGTLTTGKMSVCLVSGVDFSSEARTAAKSLSFPILQQLKKAAGATASGGGSTENAVLSFADTPLRADFRLPFDSNRKFSAGMYADGVSYFLGAPEKLIDACSAFLCSDGTTAPMSDMDAAALSEKLEKAGRESYRVVACARGSRSDFETAGRSGLSGNLEFICLFMLRDPVRKEVKGSVADAHAAGIHVIMMTGDNPDTALAVARETGIYKAGLYDRVLPAEELHRMSDSEVRGVFPRLAVISRALPADKLRLVELAKSDGLVCGMTGDGINDAPSLKSADVGFAMGSGTDVAREAGDIVITDDSFASITRAVLYGRTIFETIRKFIVFQLMMNLCAMGVSLIGPFMGIDSPVTVIQMLWVNIIMDTLGGLAFAGEPALRRYMLKKSPPRDEKILTRQMINQILICGGYSLGLSLFFLKSRILRAQFSGGNETYYLTMFFAMFIFCGIFNSFNARVPGLHLFAHIGKNKPFVFIMTAVAAAQLMIIYFGGQVFRCVPLTWNSLACAALLALSVIPADLIRKIIFRSRNKK